jgi:hypothetical protein
VHEPAHESDERPADQQKEDEDVERRHARGLASSLRHCEGDERLTPWLVNEPQAARMRCFPSAE